MSINLIVGKPAASRAEFLEKHIGTSSAAGVPVVSTFPTPREPETKHSTPVLGAVADAPATGSAPGAGLKWERGARTVARRVFCLSGFEVVGSVWYDSPGKWFAMGSTLKVIGTYETRLAAKRSVEEAWRAAK